MMKEVVTEIQSIVNLPLQIDTVNEKALEAAKMASEEVKKAMVD